MVEKYAPNLLESAALDWYVERVRVQHCALNTLRQRVGLAEQHPDKFKGNLVNAVLVAPDAEVKLAAMVTDYCKFLDRQYAIGERAGGRLLS